MKVPEQISPQTVRKCVSRLNPPRNSSHTQAQVKLPGELLLHKVTFKLCQSKGELLQSFCGLLTGKYCVAAGMKSDTPQTKAITKLVS